MALLDRLAPSDLNAVTSAFELDGVACLRSVYRAEEIALLDAVAAAAEPTARPEICEEVAYDGAIRRFYIDSGIVRVQAYEVFLVTSVTAEIAGRLMRARHVRYFADQLIVKDPGTRKPTPWHQDMPYWPVEGAQLCSVWLPIDPVGLSTAMTFVAGSHRWPTYSPRNFATGVAFGELGMPMLDQIDEAGAHRILRFEMAPGDCLVFSAMTMHGAPGNPTDRRRRAFSTRWAGEDVRHRHRTAGLSARSIGRRELDGQALDDASYPVVWVAPAGEC